ncbi:hypothetical protein [Xenorhabdus entomophaga]|uniref:hypothetical protein n=1 Tax=Xenorhabdus entomophaga TaxID=3136257 RepID=UPI0030F3CCE1
MLNVVLRDLRIFPVSDTGELPESLPAPGEDAIDPELFLFCSSGEQGILQQRKVSEWMNKGSRQQLRPQCAFVSMACASWYAAILEFERSPFHTAELWVLETSSSFVQERLDSAGLGKGGEGLQAKPGIARMVVHKCQPQEGDIVLSACSLFAKPPGLRGTELLVRRYGEWLDVNSTAHQSADWVSFSIATGWSAQLWAGLFCWFPEVMSRLKQRPSMETDVCHLLAMKPMHELHRELRHPLAHPLIITTLAAGGRVGCIVVHSHISPAEVASEPKVYRPVLVPPHPIRNGYMPDYCDPQYRYADNQYFLTELSSNDLDLSVPLHME